jgi:hypothetical protein
MSDLKEHEDLELNQPTSLFGFASGLPWRLASKQTPLTVTRTSQLPSRGLYEVKLSDKSF